MIDSFTGEYRYLSNFYPSKVTYDEVEYPTVEHAFQAAKTLDPEERETVLQCSTAGKAKRAGRKVTKREDWDLVRVGIMAALVSQKFSTDEDLARRLYLTGNELLVEGNDWGDVFWGAVDGEGWNWLGRILMGVRVMLRRTSTGA